MRVVLDTNALVRAHGRSSAQARQLLEELLKRGHRLVLSNEILAEATRVLRYPRLQALFLLTEGDLLEYTQFLQSVSHLVILDANYRAPLRDPSDLIVLQTAERGEADICARRMVISTITRSFHTAPRAASKYATSLPSWRDWRRTAKLRRVRATRGDQQQTHRPPAYFRRAFR